MFSSSERFSIRDVSRLEWICKLYSTPLLLSGTGVYCPPQSHHCSWSWIWMYLFRCRLGWNPIQSTPIEIFSYLQIYCSWNCPWPLGLVSLVQVLANVRVALWHFGNYGNDNGTLAIKGPCVIFSNPSMSQNWRFKTFNPKFNIWTTIKVNTFLCVIVL